jgi:hypothetical protein
VKIRRNFRCFSPNGYEVCPNEGDIIPVGWNIKDWDSEVSVEVTENTVVVGKTVDRSCGDGNCEVLEKHLFVRTASQVAAIAASAAADIVGHAEAARLTAIITDAGITGLSVKWGKYYPTDKVGLRMGREVVTEASIRGNLAYWLERQTEAAAKAAAKALAAPAEAAAAAAAIAAKWDSIRTSADLEDYWAAKSRDARDW